MFFYILLIKIHFILHSPNVPGMSYLFYPYHVLSIEAPFVHVFLDPLLDQVAVLILYSIKFHSTLLHSSKQSWL